MSRLRWPCCQVEGCRRRATRAVEVELPEEWGPGIGFRVLMVTIGACREHGAELTRRALAVLEARGEYADLLTVIADAVETDGALRHQVEALDRELVEAAGAADYQREHAERAEAALRIAQAAAAPTDPAGVWLDAHQAPAPAEVEGGAA
jgi:hypothetical protein